MRKEISENSTELAIGAGIGTAMTFATEIGTRVEQALNADMFEVLRQHMEWYKIFTNEYGGSLIYLDNRPLSTAIVFGITALVGYIVARSSRN
jgi:hypothetical protein